MSDDHKAIESVLMQIRDLYHALKLDGWIEPVPEVDQDYSLLVIEAGSTGVHVGSCDGDEHGYWVHYRTDSWPSRPLLVKRIERKGEA